MPSPNEVDPASLFERSPKFEGFPPPSRLTYAPPLSYVEDYLPGSLWDGLRKAEYLEGFEDTITDGLMYLAYNFGETSEDICIEDAVARASYALESGEPFPDTVWDGFRVLAVALAWIEEVYDEESTSFAYGLALLNYSEQREQLELVYWVVRALEQARIGQITLEQAAFLDANRRLAFEALRGSIDGFVGEPVEEALSMLGGQTERELARGTLLFAVRRHFEQVLDGFSVDENEAELISG